MLVIQVLVALLFEIGNLSVPSPFLHDFPGPVNRILIAVITVDLAGVFNKVDVFNVSPSITIVACHAL